MFPGGEQKDKKTATQPVLQLIRVISVTGGGPASLVDKKKIRDVFLPQAKENYHAATITSYLMSLQHFCLFLLKISQVVLTMTEMKLLTSVAN